MAYFICEKQGRCCPHEFYDSIEQAITDSEDGVPCDHLLEVSPVRHGRWEIVVGSDGKEYMVCTGCRKQQDLTGVFSYCPNCGCRMDGGDDE